MEATPGAPRRCLFPGNKNGDLLSPADRCRVLCCDLTGPLAPTRQRVPTIGKRRCPVREAGRKHLSGLLSLLAEDAMPTQKNHTDLMELSHPQA
jgi:hypothetical protein